MEVLKQKVHIGDDGILKLEVQTNLKNIDEEILLVLPPIELKQLEWHAFIALTYGCMADDPIERPPQGEYEIRDEIE